MKNNKILFLDMDGTTFHKNGDIVEANIALINKIQNDGWKICFVTGRPLRCEANNFDWINEQQNLLFAFYNGSLIFDFSNKTIIEKTLIDSNKLNQIYKYFNDNLNINLLAYLEDTKTVVSNTDKNANESIKKQHSVAPKKWLVYNKHYKFDQSAYKLLALNIEADEVNQIKKWGFNVFYNPKSKAAEINPININKGYICKKLTEYFQINQTNTACIGDGINDIEMYKYVNHTCALDNSIDNLKELSKYISPFNYLKNGIEDIYYNYLKKYND